MGTGDPEKTGVTGRNLEPGINKTGKNRSI